MRLIRSAGWMPVVLIGLFCAQAHAAFQTAVITLVFPPGARATGLGEAFTAVSDDANATYFNPAGLGQAPLANAWKTHAAGVYAPYCAIAARTKNELDMSEKIWAGTRNGLVCYNGKSWDNCDNYIIEQDAKLADIAKKFLDSDDEALLRLAAQKIREANGIEMKRSKALEVYLHTMRGDTLPMAGDTIAADYASRILDQENLYRDSSAIDGLIAAIVDSTHRGAAARSIVSILQSPDIDLKSKVELRIPYAIAACDSITALKVDATDKVWVGTPHGLWRFDGQMWRRYSPADGLPGDAITAIALGPNGEVAAGTAKGAAVLANGEWTSCGFAPSLANDSAVTAVAFGKPGILYIGTHSGLLQKKDTSWAHFDTASGLLSSEVTCLLFDSENKLWIGGANGVSVYTETAWKRYKFPNSRVLSFAEYEPGRIWIGTNKGAISYKAGRTAFDKSGKKVENPPEWKAFHSKNAIVGDQVYGVAVHGKDVWLATDRAVNEYDYADRQVFLFWELLLPTLKLRDLWHTYAAFIYPTEDWGTFGISANFINFGENTLNDEEGREIAKFRSWEGVFGLSYGLELKENFSVGLNVKYLQSALAPNIGPGDQGTARSFAIDASMLKRNLFTKGLSLGLTAQNMGPPVFYISEEEKDPIPFTVKFGLAYKALETSAADMTLLLDLNREIAKAYESGDPDPFYKAIYTDLFKKDSASQTTREKLESELEEININAGIEFWYINFLALRTGFLFDYVGQRYELTLGVGLKYGNMNFDFSYIHSPEGFLSPLLKSVISDKTNDHRHGSWGVRNQQPRVSLIFNF